MYQGAIGPKPLLAQGSSASASNPLAHNCSPIASTHAPAASSSRRRPKEPTKAGTEWERIKPLFKQLYMVENKPLKEVQQILETNESFKAS